MREVSGFTVRKPNILIFASSYFPKNVQLDFPVQTDAISSYFPNNVQQVSTSHLPVVLQFQLEVSRVGCN
jgi:hypothetical protein